MYASRRPRKCATNAIRDPTWTGGSVSHSTDLMFWYHAVTLSGSDAKAATSARGRSMSTVVTTSTCMHVMLGPVLSGRRGQPRDAAALTQPAHTLTGDEPPSSGDRVQLRVRVAAVPEPADLVLVPLRLARQPQHRRQRVRRQRPPSSPASSLRGSSGSSASGRPIPMRSTAPLSSSAVIAVRVRMPPVSMTGTSAAAWRARVANAAKYASLTLPWCRGVRGTGQAEQRGALVGAAGDLDEVDALVDEQPDDLLGVVLGEAAVPEVRGVQLDRDREARGWSPTRQARTASSSARARPATSPPHSSVRRFVRGERNCARR